MLAQRAIKSSEVIFCRACQKPLFPSDNIIGQHHLKCAKELLDSYYHAFDDPNPPTQEYRIIKSVLLFCLTYVIQLTNILTHMRTHVPPGIFLNLTEQSYLELKFFDDFTFFIHEIKKHYPHLIELLDDIESILQDH